MAYNNCKGHVKEAKRSYMPDNLSNTKPLKYYTLLALIAALLLAGGLFFIDEDRYSFRHITDPANLGSLLLYAGAFWAGQLIAARFLFTRYNALPRFLLSLVFGILIGLAILVFLLLIFLLVAAK